MANLIVSLLQKVTEEEVLHAARNEGRLALLVYASERAVELSNIPIDGEKLTSLPAALEVSNPPIPINPFNNPHLLKGKGRYQLHMMAITNHE